MLNNVSGVGRTPSFKDVIIRKDDVKTLPLEIREKIKLNRTFTLTGVGKFEVESGVNKITLPGNKPLDNYLIINSLSEIEDTQKKDELALHRLLGDKTHKCDTVLR